MVQGTAEYNDFIQDYFTVIYTCYIWLERLLNSEH